MTSNEHERLAAPPFQLPALADLQVYTPDPEVLDRHAIVSFDNRDARSRPFKLLRTQIAKRIAHRKAAIVGITSATPGAGKSFLSLNLAAALSRVAEQTVYLIDFDLRRGSVSEALGMDVETGVSDLLEGAVDDLGQIGRRIEGTNLAVFPTRPIRDNSAELIAGDRFTQLIDTFRRVGGNPTILCDMPPTFANDDTMIAMQQLDGYFLVIDSGRTTKRQIHSAMEMLHPSPCLGAVMNRYSGGFMESYGYGYGYGSSAYNDYYS